MDPDSGYLSPIRSAANRKVTMTTPIRSAPKLSPHPSPSQHLNSASGFPWHERDFSNVQDQLEVLAILGTRVYKDGGGQEEEKDNTLLELRFENVENQGGRLVERTLDLWWEKNKKSVTALYSS